MELITVSLPLLYLLASFATISESCNALQCKLLPSTTHVAPEFQSLATEKGARIVQLYLEVGSHGYRPLDQNNVFFPERWVWANSISEPMLSMGYDYDIFSLGLLNYQVKGMKVHLVEEPSGCLADLNSTCQKFVVGKVLLENVTRKTSDKPLQGGDVVCVAFLGKGSSLEGNIEYHCCGADRGGKNTTEPTLTCDLSVEKSQLYVAFDYVLLVATIIILLFWPAFSFVLPGEIVMDIENEIRKEANHGSEIWETTYGSVSNRQPSENDTLLHEDEAPSTTSTEEEKIDRLVIPVDDTSPVNCKALIQDCANRLPGFQLSFNVKLVFLSYFIIPFFLYVFVFLHLTLKGEYLEEAYRKDKAYLGGAMFILLKLFHGIDVTVLILLFLAPFFVVVSLKPNDLVEDAEITLPMGIESETYKLTVGQRINQNLSNMQDHFYQIFSSSSRSFLSRLKKFLDFTIKGFLEKAKYSLHTPRWRRMLCVCCVLIFSLIGFLVGVMLAEISLVIFLVQAVFYAIYLSPSASVLGFLCGKLNIKIHCRKCCKCPPSDIRANIFTFLVFAVYFIALLVAYGTASICCFLVIKVFGYTLMGLILNAAIATPYAIFLLVVVTNLHFCYANLQNRYREVKEIISKEWQNNKELLQDQGHFANGTDGTIPRDLFWFVCGEDLSTEYTILPIQTEILYMFRNMICVLAFLFLSLSSVIIFGNLYQISTVVSSIVVFISGVIPKLLLQGFAKEKKLVGWEKIKIARQIEGVVKSYIAYVNNGKRPRRRREEFILSNLAVVAMPDVNDVERPKCKPEEMEKFRLIKKTSKTTRE